ncbi:metallophosphoesterase [Streptomyces sp. RGM 3693]|uniref:metallophosphoesterase n=1 Tax=Streptomyces sp. RGM 3693 TaxID=3413284 RepID=UPI003D2B9340
MSSDRPTAADRPEPTVLAQLSDLHLDGGPRASERARAVVSYLLGLPGTLDGVLVTGDIADHGTDDEYRQAAKLLAPLADRYPLLLCPGNHDAREPFRRILLGGHEPGGAAVNQVRDLAGTRVVLCDSSIPGRAEGRLEAQTLEWLDATLAAAPHLPALVALHHPPVDLGLPYIDRIALREADRLAAVLGRHPQVTAVLCGHAHTAAATTFAGLPLVCAPGVASTALMPWEQEPGRSWKTEDADPALTFHLLREGRLTSHQRTVPVG